MNVRLIVAFHFEHLVRCDVETFTIFENIIQMGHNTNYSDTFYSIIKFFRYN